MKKIILIFLLLSLSGCYIHLKEADAIVVGWGGGGSSYNTTDASRGFEVDSDPSGWTEVDTTPGGKLSRYDTSQAYQGTHSMLVSVDTDTVKAYQYYDAGSTKANVSYTFWYYAGTFSGAASIAVKINIFTSSTAGSPYNCAVYYDLAATNYGFKFRGSTFPADKITVTTGNWYRIETQCNQNATSYMSVYNTDGAQVGSTISLTASNNSSRYFLFGQPDYNTIGHTYSHNFDAIGIDFTDATTPLWQYNVDN